MQAQIDHSTAVEAPKPGVKRIGRDRVVLSVIVPFGSTEVMLSPQLARRVFGTEFASGGEVEA